MADLRRPHHAASGNGVDRRRRMKGTGNDRATATEHSNRRPGPAASQQHRVRSRHASGDSLDDSSQRRHSVDQR